MVEQRPPSKRQERYLARVRGSPREPWPVMDALHTLVIQEELAEGEQLSLEWRELWDNAREDAQRYGMPESMIQRIDDAVAAVREVDPAIERIRVGDSDKVVLLLGAGASAPEPSGIPTVNSLLPELWRRAKRIGRDDIDRLAEWCEERRVTNIEDLLTAAHVANFAAKNTSVTGLLDYFLFRGPRTTGEERLPYGRPRSEEVPQVDAASIALLQDTLQTLFGLLMGTMIPARPNRAHDAVIRFLREHPSACIVTTNYDGCIDEALLRGQLGFSTLIGGGAIASDICLIKIHGSINWSYCDSCQEVREFELLDLKAAYENDSLSYPVIGICKTCGGQRRPLLVPPMGFKFVMFPNLIRLWDSARQRIEDADYLVVVGYSFSEADTYLSKIIMRSMTAKARQRIVVCDPDGSLVPNLRSRFTAHIDGFDSKRVLHAVGPCEELLPQVLESLVSPAQPAAAEEGEKASRKRRTPHRAATE